MPVFCFEADEVTLAGQHTLCLAGIWAYRKKKKKKIITIIVVIKD